MSRGLASTQRKMQVLVDILLECGAGAIRSHKHSTDTHGERTLEINATD